MLGVRLQHLAHGSVAGPIAGPIAEPAETEKPRKECLGGLPLRGFCDSSIVVSEAAPKAACSIAADRGWLASAAALRTAQAPRWWSWER